MLKTGTTSDLQQTESTSEFANFQNLEFNQLRRLPINDINKNITALIIGGNSLYCLCALESLPNLRLLNVADNNIRSMQAFPPMPELRTLILDDNLIDSFCEFPPMPQLQTLHCEDLSISLNSFEGLENLNNLLEFKISGCEITSFEYFPLAPKLQIFEMTYARVETFEHFPQLDDLRELRLINCGIVTLADLPTLQKLHTFSIESNNCDEVIDDIFAKLPSLRVLEVAENVITVESMELLDNLDVFSCNDDRNFDYPWDEYKQMIVDIPMTLLQCPDIVIFEILNALTDRPSTWRYYERMTVINATREFICSRLHCK